MATVIEIAVALAGFVGVLWVIRDILQARIDRRERAEYEKAKADKQKQTEGLVKVLGRHAWSPNEFDKLRMHRSGVKTLAITDTSLALFAGAESGIGLIPREHLIEPCITAYIEGYETFQTALVGYYFANDDDAVEFKLRYL
jgi:hypothetical protein